MKLFGVAFSNTVVTTLLLCTPGVQANETNIIQLQTHSASVSKSTLSASEIHQIVLNELQARTAYEFKNQLMNNPQVKQINFYDHKYFVLGTYNIDGRARGFLSYIEKDKKGSWRVHQQASSFLDFGRGFELFTLPYGYSKKTKGHIPTKWIIAGFVLNPEITKLRFQRIYEGGTAIQTTYAHVNEKRQIFTVIDGFGSLKIDGLNRSDRIIYGWSQF